MGQCLFMIFWMGGVVFVEGGGEWGAVASGFGFVYQEIVPVG